MIAATSASLAAAPKAVEGEWPRWRGPFDNGMARGAAPVSWSATENIKWKVEVPGMGHSSPVVWGDKIFLTTAVAAGTASPDAPTESVRRGPPVGGLPLVEHRFLTLAYDRATGRKLWAVESARDKPQEGYHGQYGSFASNSPVTDGEVLIASFGSRGVYAYTLDGEKLWERDFGEFRMRNQFGEGTAPTLYRDRVLLNFDHEGEDFLAAVNKNTGEEIWRVEREEPSNWSPPLVIERAGERPIAVVAATNRVRAYDVADGSLVWECGGLGLNAIPAPVTDGERVFVMTGYRDPNLLAIKLGGEGDLTDDPEWVLWTNQRGNSYTPSPVLHDGILYALADRGFLSAFDAATGEAYYSQQRLPKPATVKASPVGADGKLYIATEEGDVFVIGMGKEYKPLATNTLPGEFFIATPAIADGEIYLRGRQTLYAVSEATP